ncbi:glycosyltransferase family 4 protein [Methanothermobacter sp. THM-1]|uniref:glycosyltransferase family 4 protein n=1 Tax=Methanothermobacter sp. THM-1 TaxID=2606911 RepID=UPI0013676DCA|nr:glycosyltransferase family 4 protein [Methanothermobacter sp. THM-1]QHN06097.1 glycosyltransferase family 4 protein [Methanothermobacter sp. THM-1]
MRILIVSDFFVPHYNGGGERRYFEIARRLVRRGHEVDVISMRIHGVPDHEEIEGIHVHHVGPRIRKPPIRKPLDFMRFMLAVFLWICRNDYDIIDAQTYSPLLPSLLAARLRGIPMVATIHDVSSSNGDQWLQSSGLASILERILMRLPYDGVITVSRSTASALMELYGRSPEGIHIIPNGVDLELIDSTLPATGDYIIFVGRLAPHKHVDHLIEVFRSLSSDFPGLKLEIIGDGVERTRLKGMVDEYGIGARVSFHHSLSYREVISLIKGAKVLVLPSTREGFGMVLAEANACSVPVVAYRSGGVVEVINDGENGFLVEPCDRDSLKEKIRLILKNDDIRVNMGKKGRERIEKYFLWDILVNSLENIYKNLANKITK